MPTEIFEEKARKIAILHKQLGRPSLQQFKVILRNKSLPGCNITAHEATQVLRNIYAIDASIYQGTNREPGFTDLAFTLNLEGDVHRHR
jgi:hypothetical protein